MNDPDSTFGMNDSDSTSGLAWHRYFWPWFIVALLFASFVAGVSLVVIAFANQDSLVSELWYESGTQINRRLESERNATRQSIRAELRIDSTTGEVRVDLTGEGVATVQKLVLDLSHPTRASRDRSISLVRSDSGSFRGQLSAQLSGRWYAVLAPLYAASASELPVSSATVDASDPWRLTTTLHLPSLEFLVMGGSG
jgi:hypothetical protein